jgi:two-component system LytT family response regulator
MMKRIKVLIVDDEPLVHRILSRLMSLYFPEIDVVGNAGGVKEASELIVELDPDLMFLDIQLSDGLAFELFKLMPKIRCRSIFITAHHEFALEALRFSSIDFVFKPFDMNELVAVIDKSLKEIRRQKSSDSYQLKIDALLDNLDPSDDSDKQLVLAGSSDVNVVALREILWIDSFPGGSRFHLTNATVVETSIPVRRYEAMLQSKGFYRCHPKCVVNLLHVDWVEPQLSYLQLHNGTVIDIESRRYNQLILRLRAERCMLEL